MFDYLHYKKNQFLDWFTYTFNNPYLLPYPAGYCPVQIETYLLTGEFFYFRARGSQWSVDIADTEKDWWEQDIKFHCGERNFCEWPNAGYISKRLAIKLATKALNKYYKNDLVEFTKF
jgi:hypothetical protein